MRKLILFAALALPLTAQQPAVQNGHLTTEPQIRLEAEVARLKAGSGTTWLTYAVPANNRIEQNGRDVTYLEGGRDHGYNASDKPGTAPFHALVLLRVADHTLNNIRVADPARKLDAGGTNVVYLPEVDAAASIALLQSLAEQSASVRDSAIFAISIHASPATVPALASLASPNHDLAVREKAAFWLSTQHSAPAVAILDRFAREDKDERFREKLAFDLTLVHQPGALDTLVRMAHQDPAPAVRKQAQFWMAQTASQLGKDRVTGELTQSALDDPNEEVRKSAVFGISQLPDGGGTPKLIDLAETSKDPAVRKQAVFWLGQSNDPRALAYLTKLIQR